MKLTTIFFQIILNSKSILALLSPKIISPNRSSPLHSESSKSIDTTKQKIDCNKIEDVGLLTKESFFCFRMKDKDETCVVECKRIDDKPLGYCMDDGRSSSGNEDSGKRRAFAFAQNVDSMRNIYPGPCFIHIREIPFSYGKLGGSVWYASIALAQYMLSNLSIIKDKKILELGAGVGIPGLLAAKCHNGAKSVTLTEFGLDGEVDGMILENNKDKRLLPSALLNNLVYNVDINGLEDKVTVRHLDWYDYCNSSPKQHSKYNESANVDDSFDLIIGSDLVNWEDDVVPLIETLKYFLSNGNTTTEALIALSGENRRALPNFLDIIKKEFGIVNVMDASLIHYDEHPILIIGLKDPLNI